MGQIYRKVYIRSEANLPEKVGLYFAYIRDDKNKTCQWYDSDLKEYWIRNIDWYLQPIELPSEEEIDKQFPTDIQTIKVKEGFDKMSYNAEQSLRMLGHHNQAKREGAKWMLSQIKGK